MKKLEAKQILLPTLCLLLICIVVGGALALTNLVTADRIAALQKKQAEEAMSRVLPAEEYVKLTIQNPRPGEELYSAGTKGGVLITGYIVTAAAKGYGGDVKVMTGLTVQGEVTKVEILDCSGETPGLGQEAKKSWFTDQFQGLLKTPGSGENGKLVVKKDIDALTGATITSTAVTDAVNRAREIFDANVPKPTE